ncbi:MAG: HD domain-containing phosphohydrolase [Planctomycetota bacterium]
MKTDDCLSFLSLFQPAMIGGGLARWMTCLREAVDRHLPCEQVFFYRHDAKWKELYRLRFPRADDPGALEEETRFPVGQGIAGIVAQTREPYLSTNPAEDEYFQPDADSAPATPAREILAAPVLTLDEELFGVIHLVNKRSGTFSTRDIPKASDLASVAGSVVDGVLSLEAAKEFSSSLADALALAVDLRTLTTINHTEKIRRMALSMGRYLSLTPQEMEVLSYAVRFHDLGKLLMRDATLETPENPKDVIQEHLFYTRMILERLKLPTALAAVPKVALSHHERSDGSGHPIGTLGKDMSLMEKILIVVNHYDNLVTGAYADHEFTQEEALKTLQAEAGKTLDAYVVKCFVDNRVYEAERRQHKRFSYKASVRVSVLSRRGDTMNVFEAQAEDVSETGVLFMSKTEIPLYAVLDLEIQIPTGITRAKGKVARVIPGPDGYRIGAYIFWME